MLAFLYSLVFLFFPYLAHGTGGRLQNNHRNRNNPITDNTHVEIRDRHLLVNGEEFFIKGVCYSPVPVGETPTYEPHGDYFTNRYAYIWKRDLPLLKRMGANVLRLYGWDTTGEADHSSFLNEVHKHGLKVLITFWLGTSYDTPVRTPEQRQLVIERFKKQVAAHGDHPAILMWSFGNELNGHWNGFMGELSESYGCNWNQGCMGNADPGSWCTMASDCMYTQLFNFINAAAKAARTVTTRPITSGFADLDFFVSSPARPWIDKVAKFEHLLPDLGAWALQLYRGRSFGSVFQDFQSESSKPILVTEFGVDAFNDPCGWPENAAYWVCFNMYNLEFWGGDMAMPGAPFHGCQNKWMPCAYPGVEMQAQWDRDLAIELENNAPDKGGAVIGGFVMAWSDEYWKGASVQNHCNFPCPWQEAARCRGEDIEFFTSGQAQCNEKAHFTCNNYDPSYHDLCGYFLWSSPDQYVNEEWFGITTPIPCQVTGPSGGYHLDGLRVRPVYLELQKLWRGDSLDSDLSMLTVDCEKLKPCHYCLMKYLDSQIADGACDTACGTFLTVAAKPAPAPWVSRGFWQDYFALIVFTLCVAAAALIALLGVAINACRKGREGYHHNS